MALRTLVSVKEIAKLNATVRTFSCKHNTSKSMCGAALDSECLTESGAKASICGLPCRCCHRLGGDRANYPVLVPGVMQFAQNASVGKLTLKPLTTRMR